MNFFFYLSIFLFSEISISDHTPISCNTSEVNKIFQNLNEDVIAEIFSWNPPTHNIELRFSNKFFWSALKSWSQHMNQIGLLTKKNNTFVYLPDEIQQNEIEDLEWLWKNEFIASSKNGEEPKYLQILSRLQKQGLDTFYQNHSPKHIKTKHEWITFHKKLFLVNLAMLGTARLEASNAAMSTGGFSAWDACNKAAWTSTWTAIGKAGQNTTQAATWVFIKDAAKKTVKENEGKTLRNIAKKVMNLIEHSTPWPIQVQNIGRYTYRSTEKTALIYFIKNMQQTYLTMFEQLSHIQFKDETYPFSSLHEWSSFQNTYFSHLNEHQIHFIQPILQLMNESMVTSKKFPNRPLTSKIAQ